MHFEIVTNWYFFVQQSQIARIYCDTSFRDKKQKICQELLQTCNTTQQEEIPTNFDWHDREAQGCFFPTANGNGQAIKKILKFCNGQSAQVVLKKNGHIFLCRQNKKYVKQKKLLASFFLRKKQNN